MLRVHVWQLALVWLFVARATEAEWQYFCFEGVSKLSGMGDTDFTELPGRVEHAPEPAAAAAETGSEDVGDTTTPLDRFRKLKGTCYFMRVGYWTYEVCPYLRVRQYHAESGGGTNAPVHSEFSLGNHDSAHDEWKPSKQVYQQVFGAGSEGRQSTVRYICPESRRDEDGIVVVHEPRAKEYVFTVRISVLCAAAGDGVVKPAVQRPQASRDNSEVQEGDGPGAQIAEMVVPHMRLLNSLKGRCFHLTKDYWTYELCPTQHVRQYRQEGAQTKADTLLGTYDPERDRLTLGVRGKLDKALIPHTFTQNYVNGTGNRVADVRARCSTKNEHSAQRGGALNPGSLPESPPESLPEIGDGSRRVPALCVLIAHAPPVLPGLLAVEEPTMHNYVLLFLTPLACEINCAYSRTPVH
jgi:hypothetical protein